MKADDYTMFNPLNAELNPICHLLALLGAHLILHVSRIRVNCRGLEVQRNADFILCGVCSSLHNFLADRRANIVAYDSLGFQARINITYLLHGASAC
jgi:hypothetical protein